MSAFYIITIHIQLHRSMSFSFQAPLMSFDWPSSCRKNKLLTRKNGTGVKTACGKHLGGMRARCGQIRIRYADALKRLQKEKGCERNTGARLRPLKMWEQEARTVWRKSFVSLWAFIGLKPGLSRKARVCVNCALK